MNYQPRSRADVLRLVEAYPLAWLIGAAGPAFDATPLPLLPETDASGAIVSLLGHFALRNPQVELLRRNPRALILFSGPHGYISPRLVSQRGWAPTWNYAVAKFQVDIEFVPDENLRAIEKLVEKMEGDVANPWQVAEVGTRLESMLRQIIAFRAHVRSVDGRFKLGQDEKPETHSELLARVADHDLTSWMADYGPPQSVATGMSGAVNEMAELNK
ncbi:MAG: FMN-binding negative transcriptional regulator [Rhodospirillaceae bacterium]|nr:FMN-binding negative transcriptional regulator [Rhodospirillaceae bacterium]